MLLRGVTLNQPVQGSSSLQPTKASKPTQSRSFARNQGVKTPSQPVQFTWVAVVAIFVLVAVGIIAIIDYIHNHGKPDRPSSELTAINELATDLSNKFKILSESSEKGNKAIIAEIRALRTELKGNRDDRPKE